MRCFCYFLVVVRVAMGNYVTAATGDHYWATVTFVYKVRYMYTFIFIDTPFICQV